MPAVERATPCPHLPACPGCPLIGLPYGEQLRRKRQRLKTALAAYDRLRHAEVPEVSGSPHVFGYRTQAKLVVRRAARGLLIGVYRHGSHQVVDISQCQVHHPLINRVVAAARAEIEERRLSAYDEREGRGVVRYIAVRVSAWRHRAQLILVTADDPPAGTRTMAGALHRRLRAIESVVQNVNREPGNAVFGGQYVPWTRDTALLERVGALKLTSRPGSFLQANIPVARRLYGLAAAWAAPGENDVVADLYCGVGALAFHLAAGARHVLGIEEAPTAVLDAKDNIRLNGFHNVRFRGGRVEDELPPASRRLQRLEVITANPPRKGIDLPAREAIAACAPRRIVYVSCDPDTLSRDLDWFSERGYDLTRVQPFDMFPQTEHVETVALLERAGP